MIPTRDTSRYRSCTHVNDTDDVDVHDTDVVDVHDKDDVDDDDKDNADDHHVDVQMIKMTR